MFYYVNYSSPFGGITIASDSEAVIGVWFDGQKYFADTVSGKLEFSEKMPVLRDACEWLDEYFGGGRPEIKRLELAPQGNEFRQKVWNILCKIPYGETVTYGDIAKEMASVLGRKSMSAQAVGGAVGHNPISIIIPCHRVVGSNGSLTGYAGGIDKKIKLLELEGVDISRYKIPLTGTAV